MPKKGDICLVPYPFTDQATAKLRPALVAQGFAPFMLALNDGQHSPMGQHVIFIPITSKISQGNFNIILDANTPGFAKTGLKAASTLLCWNVNTIHKDFIQRTIGVLDPEVMLDVDKLLRRILSL
jgi:mRNA-degrading endonuclease toxin of MazEF toxin-antitoxin module